MTNQCNERLRHLRKVKDQDETEEYLREQAKLRVAALNKQALESDIDNFGDENEYS